MSGIEAAAVAPVWEAIKGSLCFCCARVDYFDDLETNLRSSKREMNRLKEMKEHVETRVRHEKKPQMQQLYKVTDWLRRVNDWQEDEEEIIKEGEEELRNKALRLFCPKHCCSYNRVGKKVSGKLKEATELIKDGDFDVVFEKRAGDLVNEIPVPETIGLEFKVEEVWRLVEDPSVGIIGLYGIGGVGKTTLLKKMYNKISSTGDYVVIWVDRWEQDPVKAVQEAIRKKFEISDDIWKNKNEADSVATWKYLKSEKFVLLLDDVGDQWHYHLLEEVSVPLNGNDNGSKIIFTTRSKRVCDRMRAECIEVKCLPLETARQLFQLCVGRPVLNAHSEIPKLAKDAADACNGLPLLLVTFGRAMASKTNFRDWKLEVQKLKAHPTTIPDVEAHVFSVLKVSYDTLSTDTLRRCFLYLSLFPQGHHIKKQELIDLWIGEGLLDGFKDVFDARQEGEEIISSLKLASLLESSKSEEYVNMHVMIREMALWLASEEGKAEDKLFVQEKTLESAKWVNAKRISLWYHSIESVPDVPSCRHLTTLLLRATNLKKLPSGFFQSMHALTVLDLAHNNGLADLPAGIGELRSLLYLNLSGTSIENLPLEVQNMKRLRILITSQLVKIEHGIISSILSLLVFRMLVHPTQRLYSPEYDEASVLEELECLEHINELGMVLCSTIGVQKLLNSHKLRSSIALLQLMNLPESLSKLSLKRMEHLERLELWDCSFLMEMDVDNENEEEFQGFHKYPKSGQECFQNLSIVSISNCRIKNVTWLIHAPNLRTLTLINCSEIVEVVSDHFGQDIFSNLTDLSLSSLPKLESICPQAQFPSLTRLLVDSCLKLKKLPFSSSSAKNLKEIRGEKSWWSQLQWASETIRDAFFPKLQLTKTKAVISLITLDGKSRHKALKVAVSCSGVESVTIGKGEQNKMQMVVIGKEIDMVRLVVFLRKKVGYAELISVSPEPAEEGKNDGML